MSVAFSSLTSDQQATIKNFVDLIYRPTMGKVARILMNEASAVLSGALASPSVQPSSAESPASDSIWGLLASLTGTEVVPIGPSNLAGISPLQAQVVLWNLADLASVVAAHTTAQAVQNFTLIVGAGNLVGPA
jgi:hypothetical protein